MTIRPWKRFTSSCFQWTGAHWTMAVSPSCLKEKKPSQRNLLINFFFSLCIIVTRYVCVFPKLPKTNPCHCYVVSLGFCIIPKYFFRQYPCLWLSRKTNETSLMGETDVGHVWVQVFQECELIIKPAERDQRGQREHLMGSPCWKVAAELANSLKPKFTPEGAFTFNPKHNSFPNKGINWHGNCWMYSPNCLNIT